MLMSSPPPLPLLGLPPIALSSPAVDGAGRLAREFTCAGKGETPPLSWGAPPQLTRSLAIVVDDPDVPGSVHWMVYDLPPETRGLVRGALGRNGLPPPALSSHYEPPCDRSPRRRYRVRIFAVDQPLPPRLMDYGELERLLAGHLLGVGELDATYAPRPASP
jgi:phosphatidylethanolamine-binding protein (PEBP) family uncharacterized protein